MRCVGRPLPAVARLPAFELMIAGLAEDDDAVGERAGHNAAVERRRAQLMAALRR